MRHESLYFLFSPVSRLKGIGGATSMALQRLLPSATIISGQPTPIVRDLLFHLPVGLMDRRATWPLASAPDGIVGTFIVTVKQHLRPSRRGSPYKIICTNDTGDITLVYFHAHGDYLQRMLPVGATRVISGRTEHFDYRLQMTHPDIVAPVSQLAEVQKPEPVYPLTAGMTSRRIGKLINDTLAKLPDLPEWLALFPSTSGRGWREAPGEGLSTQGLSEGIVPHPSPLPKGEGVWPSWKSALTQVHHPESQADLSPEAPARLRLAYDEMLATQLYLGLARRHMQSQAGPVITGTGELTNALRQSLPFQLTHGQEAVLGEIYADMASGKRMGRLLQGDVGSGKTIVALLAMLRVAEHGLQSALMAPTEIIAQQHYEVIASMLKKLPPPLRGRAGVGGSATYPLAEHGYGKTALNHAKDLRTNATEAEKKLWSILRDSQLSNLKFRRQQPIGKYIADFFCPEARLIVELDGGQHSDQATYDAERTAFLEAQGYRVLRFWNNDMLTNPEAVYNAIAEACGKTPPPAPLPQGEGVKVILLTGSVKGKAREQALADIASGEAKIVVGTHALFQDQVIFNNLALTVIDEQHRFGVGQRMALTNKGESPHLLHMTATPIPRTLTMTLYGDMDCSLLTEKPAGRKPIATRVIPLSRYGEVMERLKAALERGEKAYWICPLIESSEYSDQSSAHFLNPELCSPDPDSDLAAATSRFTEFTARFGPIVSLAHGRMKSEDRDREMRRFAGGDTRLLVATTVVEVGVDVRDATIMVIEQAERFGLSQLHQLRGRVGRGDKPSSCVLLYSEGIRDQALGIREEAALSPNAQSLMPNAPLARLSVLRDTEDGFRIAEEDLLLRGGGDLLGSRQSGFARFMLADLAHHRELLAQARDEARAILAVDPELTSARGQALRILLQLFGFEIESLPN